jgi:hypothetical protein
LVLKGRPAPAICGRTILILARFASIFPELEDG